MPNIEASPEGHHVPINPSVDGYLSDNAPPPSHTSQRSHSSTTLFHPPVPEPEHEPRRTLWTRLDHACLHMSPSFFSLNMGTGIASILLYNLPYNAQWLQRIGIVIFILNIVLFALISIFSIIRYIRWKGIFTALNMHTMAGMYWGCLPMGLITIVVSLVAGINKRGLSC